MTDRPEEGDVFTVERTFTKADVRAFAEVSEDTQPRHTEPDEDGRLMVHGLLTATLPTKIGGNLEVLASRLDFHFRKPVYTGDTVTCEWDCVEVSEADGYLEVVGDITCTNQDGEVVMTARGEGRIYDD
ncbi:MaoC family dehydratase N-terminal domain-containing protein [Halorientalis brevis]|uniref:MaoC family dehydratase N-terminal domain-containing protein n=1 Tax=Halorientalis brevis TaxID=1126241 RepID=A0ABD6C840_9EURY|nr:MaoC family dehydratase N-terminal domain-containing protein [Halorientalis brevis]